MVTSWRYLDAARCFDHWQGLSCRSLVWLGVLVLLPRLLLTVDGGFLMETIGHSAAASIASVEPVLIVVGGAIIALAAVALGIRWELKRHSSNRWGASASFFSLVLVIERPSYPT